MTHYFYKQNYKQKIQNKNFAPCANAIYQIGFFFLKPHFFQNNFFLYQTETSHVLQLSSIKTKRMRKTKTPRSIREHTFSLSDDEHLYLKTFLVDFEKYIKEDKRIQCMFVPIYYSAMDKDAFMNYYTTNATQLFVNDGMTMVISGVHINLRFWNVELRRKNLRQFGNQFDVFACPFAIPIITFAHPWPCANQVDNCSFDVNVTCTHYDFAQPSLSGCRYIICVRPASAHSAVHDTNTGAESYVTISPSVAFPSDDKIGRARLCATPRLLDKRHEIFQCELRVVRDCDILARIPLPYNLNVFSSCCDSSNVVITDFYPRVGKADTDLWISGSGFLPSAVIMFGETVVHPSVSTQYMLRCKIPGSLMGMCPLYVMCGNDKSIAPAIFVFDAMTNENVLST